MEDKGRKQRIQLIEKLQDKRNSAVIVYMTSERPPVGQVNFATGIALDVFRLFYNHLKKIGKQKISLIICSNGGELDAPWPLVNLIREYCEEFEVIVPFKALSAASLIALGADKILMSPLSQLSPVDPTRHIESEGKRIDIAVEDIIGFVDFAKERIGIIDEQYSDILKALVDDKDLNPQYIGSIYRTYSLIRRLSTNLLKLHLKTFDKEDQINEIVNNMTQKLFSHSHWINRHEAKNIIGLGEIVQYTKPDEEEILDKFLSSYYYKALETNVVFDPGKIIGNKNKFTYTTKRAFIESKELAHVFETEFLICKSKDDKITVSQGLSGWKEYRG